MTDDEKSMLDALFDATEGLSDWEIDFIDSLERLRETDTDLSPRQRSKLITIYDERL